MEKVYRGAFECELCKTTREFRVFGMDDTAAPGLRANAADWAKHYHWCDDHRVCALCGDYVNRGELELIANLPGVRIHEKYTDEYRKVTPGDVSHGLIVHGRCILRKTETTT